MTTVHCVGDVMTDVVALLPGPLAAGSDTPARVRTSHGGAAANTAAWLAELGVPVRLTARIGDDPAGLAAAAALAGVTLDLQVDPDLPTGTVVVLVDPDGERTMIPDAGANAALTRVNVGPEEHLHVSGYALFHPAVRPVVVAAMARASALSLDLASAAPLSGLPLDEVRAWCAAATVFANADEARVVTGCSDPDRSAAELSRWCRVAVVKVGSGGAVVGEAGVVTRVPVPGRSAPVDTTGAGDAFAAGYLAAGLAGAGPAAAAANGHRIAARVLNRLGARPVAAARARTADHV